MYYVYILQSKQNSEPYTGSSNDLKKRFREHNDGKVTSTKRYKPWKLIYYEAYQTEKLARIREKRLKYNGNAMRELKKRIGFSNPRQTFRVLKSGVALPSTTFRTLKSGAGFTFIELILYISIVTVMLSALIPFAWNVIEGGAKSSTEQEVFSQARYVSERLKYEIRNANSINSVNSPVNTIDLNTLTNSTTVIDLSNGKIRIKYGAGTAIPLNSDDTAASLLTFTNYTSLDNKTKHIQFSFTMDDTGTSTRQEYQVPAVNIESSTEVRSN